MPANGACAQTVIEVSAAKMESAFGRDVDLDDDGTPDGDYLNKKFIAFGIGQNSDLVGRTLQEAPVHFAKNADMNASQAYNRFVAVYTVDADATHNKASARRATYFGTAMVMNDLIGLQAELSNYYTDAAENN